MSKNENKTKTTETSVESFLKKSDDKKREDSNKLIAIMKDISGDEPKMWGTSIIGFGKYHYKYTSGREGDWMRIGFSPRKAAISLYLSCDADQFSNELKHLGKHTRGKGCVYIKTLDDIDEKVLRTILKKAYSYSPYEV